MQRPPLGVKLVIEAVCIMKGIKPKKVPGERPGSKVDDYWEPGKGLLQDPGRFLESLFKFDKVSVACRAAGEELGAILHILSLSPSPTSSNRSTAWDPGPWGSVLMPSLWPWPRL